MTDFYTEEVPQKYMPYINRLRRFILDYPEINKLEEVQENSDLDLYYAILDAMDEINITSVFTEYKEPNQFPWSILRLGALLNLLVSKGVLSARNSLTYNDAGGVTVQDYDKYGRYINLFNVLINKYMSSITSWKLSQNVDSCYGGVPSEFYLGYSDD